MPRLTSCHIKSSYAFVPGFLAGLLLVLSCAAGTAVAQTKVWTGTIDSNWHKGGNWNPAGVPSSSSTVSIRPQGGNPYPVITQDVTIANLTLSEWYSGGDLTVAGSASLTITNNFNMFSNGNLYIQSTASVALTGNPINMGGNRSQVIDIQNEGHFSSTSDFNLQGTLFGGAGTLSFGGSLTVSNGSVAYVEDATITTAGAATINGTYNGDDGLTTFNGFVQVNSGGIINLDTGTINFNSGARVSNNGTANLGSGTANLQGTITVSSDGHLNVQDATMNITGSADFTSNGNLTVNSGSINVDGDASLSNGGSFSLSSGSLSVGGDASFTNGGDVDAGSATIDLQGDLTVQSGGSFTPGTSTVKFSGGTTQTINTGGSDLTFYNVEVTSGSSVQTDGSGENTIIIENNLSVDSTSSVGVQDNDTIDIQGNLHNEGEIDSVQPFIYSISTPSLTTVVVRFDKAMDETTTETVSNYAVNNGIAVTDAVLDPSDPDEVTLTVSTLTEGVEYELTVNNLQSTDGGEVSDNHIKRFTVMTQITYYSRTSGHWDDPASWSTQSHSGAAASSVPNAQAGDRATIGDNHTITVTTTEDLSVMDWLIVDATGTLNVGSQGTLILNTFAITGNGTFTLSPGGTLDIGSDDGIAAAGTASGNIRTDQRNYSNQGNYIYSGSNGQQTGSGLPQQVNDLHIDNPADLTATANIHTAGTLYLKNGSLIIPSGRALIANTKSIQNGNLIFKRILSGSPGWRMISSPLEVSYANFLDGILTQGYDGAAYDAGTVPYDTLQPNILYYDESYAGTDNQRWRPPSSAAAPVPAGRGFNAFLFGDVSGDSRYNDALPDTLTVEGQEFEGTGGVFDFNVTFTAAADSGWNLAGNPFGASIDWDDDANWTKTGIDHTVYVWDPENRTYRTWNSATNIGTLGSGLIPPFQAFWVKANAQNPVLAVDEEAKALGGTFVGKQRPPAYPKIELALDHNGQSGSIFFTFTEGALVGKDPSDAYLLEPPPGITDYMQFYTVAGEKQRFVINALPRRFGIPIEIPISAGIYRNGHKVTDEVDLTFKTIQNIPPGWKLSLVDRLTGRTIAATPGTEVTFQTAGTIHAPQKGAGASPVPAGEYKILADASPREARFMLKIQPGADGTGLPRQVGLRQNYPNPASGPTTIRFTLPIQDKVTLTVYDILGRPVDTIIDNQSFIAGQHPVTWNATHLASGTYIYVLKTSDHLISRKLTIIR